MIKKIPVERLNVGMFIHDLNCSWTDHNFLMNRFLVKNDQQINKIRSLGIRELYIDSDRGADLQDAPSEEEVRNDLESGLIASAVHVPPATRKPIPKEQTSLKMEMVRAKVIQKEALRVVHNVLTDVRLGKQVEVEKVEPVVEQVTHSIFRNPEAMLTLCRIKNKDTYTFEHCVSVCALLTSFSRSMGMNQETIREAGIGGLLHDVGKMRVPISILNKPGKLTEEEFEIIKTHVALGRESLEHTEHISLIALQITGEHHERFDGKGYPAGLDSQRITLLGRMAAIVDVYDAITSDRVYHKGMPPHEAIRKLYEWSQHNFEPDLVENFIRVVGIYPAGSVVTLRSGKVGIVITHRQNDLLHPVLRIIYDYRREARTPPHNLDLASEECQQQNESIVGVNEEILAKLGINPLDYI